MYSFHNALAFSLVTLDLLPLAFIISIRLSDSVSMKVTVYAFLYGPVFDHVFNLCRLDMTYAIIPVNP